MFKNPFSFNGRIRRLEYGLSNLIYIFSIFLVVLVFEARNSLESSTGSFIIVLWYIPCIWFMLAQGTKRCQDRGNSGWWQLIPFYGFWMMFAPGDIGDNEYGPNPKGLYYDFEEGNETAPIDDVDEDGIIK
ncbi:DUF805 domain-containing protein [Pedobacter heparinus]|uniref:DUF805 domain-containing protein n=1 Tax=Pedobacter heparinus TaxID=984 RepID=UPI00292F54FF|nr:DUF805 domain-containing protein [Pedobacter heparinus]